MSQQILAFEITFMDPLGFHGTQLKNPCFRTKQESSVNLKNVFTLNQGWGTCRSRAKCGRREPLIWPAI